MLLREKPRTIPHMCGFGKRKAFRALPGHGGLAAPQGTAVWRQPLLGPVAQFRLLLDALRNARTTRPHSRGGILRISWSTRVQHRVGDVAKSRPQRRAS